MLTYSGIQDWMLLERPPSPGPSATGSQLQLWQVAHSLSCVRGNNAAWCGSLGSPHNLNKKVQKPGKDLVCCSLVLTCHSPLLACCELAREIVLPRTCLIIGHGFVNITTDGSFPIKYRVLEVTVIRQTSSETQHAI